MSRESSADAIESSQPPDGGEGPSEDKHRWRSGPLKGFALGILGGCIAWAVLFACYPVFFVPEELSSLAMPAPTEDILKYEAALTKVTRYNAMFAMSVFGAILGTILAVGEGASRRSVVRCATAVLGCALIAALSGSLGGWLGHHVQETYRFAEDLTPLARTIRVQVSILATSGAGLGLGIGLFLGRGLKSTFASLFAGVTAGAAAGMMYPFLVAVFFPSAKTEVLIPMELRSHLLWLGLSTGLLGLIIYGVACQRPKVSSGRPEEAESAE